MAERRQPSHLLGIPIEIRRKILTYALPPLDQKILAEPKPNRDRGIRWFDRDREEFPCPAILLVCQQILTECAQLQALHGTLVIQVQPSRFGLPSHHSHATLARSLDVTMAVAGSHSCSQYGLSNPSTAIYLPTSLEAVVSRLKTTFPQSQEVTLTLGCHPFKLDPDPNFPNGLTVINLRTLLFHPWWQEKVTTIRLHLSSGLTVKLFNLARDGSADLVKQALGHAADLPNLRQVELLVDPPLSWGFPQLTWRFPIAQTNPIPGMTPTMLAIRREERRTLSPITKILPTVFPRVKNIRLRTE